MREFFKGWRRKLGVVTLVMACVMVGLWSRSQFDPGKLQTVHWSAWEAELKDGDFVVSKQRESGIGGSNGLFHFRGPHEEEHFRTHYIYPGVKYSISIDQTSNTSSIFKRTVSSIHVNLLFFAIVTTLLSAYLLLSKPRTAKKPEPSPPAGT